MAVLNIYIIRKRTILSERSELSGQLNGTDFLYGTYVVP